MLIKKNRIPILQILSIDIFPSFLKKIVYRIKGCQIGSMVKLGFGSLIIGDKFELREKRNNEGIVFSLSNSKHKSFVNFQIADSNIEKEIIGDNILILFKSKISYKGSYKMIINIHDKTREGTSIVGEELMSFFSRFGIRFNRID